MLLIYIYWFIFSTSSIGLIGLVKGGHKYINFGIIYLVFSTIILLSIRDVTAPADAANYVHMYMEINVLEDIFSSYHKDYFFSFIQYLSKTMGLSVEKYFIVLSSVCFLLSAFAFRMIFDDDRKYIASLSFFVVTSTFVLLYTNVLRQGLSLSLVLLGIGFIVRKKYFIAILIAALAFYSHAGSLPILIITAIASTNLISRNKLKVMLIATPFLPLIYIFVLDRIVFFESYLSKIDKYSNFDYNTNILTIKVSLLYFLSILLYWFGSRKNAFKNEVYLYIYRCFVFVNALVFLFLPIAIVSSRYLYYSSALLPILFSCMMFQQKSNINVSFRYIFGTICFFIFGMLVYNFNSVRAQLGT